MCNNYTNRDGLADWAKHFEEILGQTLHLAAGEDTLSNQPWTKDVYPKYQGLFARPLDPQDPGAGLEPAVGRWGVVPFFHKGPAKTWKFPTNNCRSEEMATKASFRDALKSKRCVIPVTGFCESTGPRGKMTKHLITRAGGGPLFLAGLWASHVWEGERTDSYTMLMMEAEDGDDMRPFHNRQPIALDREGARTWLDLAGPYQPVLRAVPGTLAFDPPEPAPA